MLNNKNMNSHAVKNATPNQTIRELCVIVLLSKGKKKRKKNGTSVRGSNRLIENKEKERKEEKHRMQRR